VGEKGGEKMKGKVKNKDYVKWEEVGENKAEIEVRREMRENDK
jgi:hypothetical protein